MTQELPKGWISAPLGEVAACDWGNTTLTKAAYVSNGFIAFSASGPDGFLPNYEQDCEGVVLSAIGARCGKCFLATGKWSAIKNTITIVPDGIPAVIAGFLFRYLNREDLWPKRGGGQPFIGLGDVRTLLAPIPPPKEQRRIVAKLEALNERSRRAKAALDAVPPLVEKFKQSVLAAAFRGDLTADWRAKLQGSEGRQSASIREPYIHEIDAPATWTQSSIGELCEIQGGSQPPKSTFIQKPRDGYVRLIQIRDYKSDKYATYIPRELARRFCTSTDIMIGRYGPPIFQILRGLAGAYNVALMKAVPNEARIEAEFLYYYLQHPQLRLFVEAGSQRTAGQDGVRKEELYSYPIFLPPKEEQTLIVQRIESMLHRHEEIKSTAEGARGAMAVLDRAILAKAFRGELVEQDPNDEPASVLLERIRAEREKANGKTSEKRAARRAQSKRGSKQVRGEAT